MPRLSESMEEGTIVRWLKADGDAVARGDALLEIETDKATTTHEAEHAGVLRIIAREGQTLAIGAPIAQLEDGAQQAGGQQEGVEQAEPAQTGQSSAQPASQAAGEAPAVQAEPGSGAPSPQDAALPAGRAPAPQTAKGTVTVIEPTRAQQLIARRVAESRATVPTFALRGTIDMRACAELRASLRDSGADVVPSLNDLIVKACAVALAEHPPVNGCYRDGHFERYSRVNVAFAVAATGTLLAPTIFDADRKGLAQIALESEQLAERVRRGEVTPPELAGATFTVSNLGMYGVRSFEAVISSGQAAILSAGAVEQRPVVRGGEVVVREQMDVELTCDHRVLYGAPAATFLARVRELLEEPLRMAL